MPENDKGTTDYIKGFNEGYVITRHLPELADRLAAVEAETPRIDGFKDGRKQLVLDQLKDSRAKWAETERRPPSQNMPDKSDKTQSRDLDKE